MRVQGQGCRVLRLVPACALLIAFLVLTGGCYRSYVCENRRIIETRDQAAGDRVIIDVGDGDITLPRVPAASGSKFSDGRRTVWFHGDELTVEADGKRPYGRCVLVK
ncbi:MAG: Membrane-bound lysozyme-inhibitor of c-type lysozyme [Syntrophaceae bacterium PtaU1.Bin231]|nr:MAG: Membrane-bound lysozyme-inhibitor of c-type lysozyme [Syntrophaceae bacterium PtaU1.Bin231]